MLKKILLVKFIVLLQLLLRCNNELSESGKK